MRYMTMEGMNSLGGVCLTDGRMGEVGTGGRGRGGQRMKRKSSRGSSDLHQRKATVRPAGATLHSSGCFRCFRTDYMAVSCGLTRRLGRSSKTGLSPSYLN